MTDLIVCRLQDSVYTTKDVVELIISSFSQWKEMGIYSSLLKLTPESFSEKTVNDVVLIAIDKTNNTLCGTTSFTVLQDKQGHKYAYNKYSAVSNLSKQNGIGSKLIEYEKQLAFNDNCCYIISDTSTLAKWSKRWHLKNGFKVIGLKSFSNNDYYSYIFRLQLQKSFLWSSELFCNLMFCISSIKTRLMYDKFGNYTCVGRFIVKVIK